MIEPIMIKQDNLEGPIFVVGNSRSGTTMMGNILRNHPMIFTLHHEIHFFEQLCESKNFSCYLSIDKAVNLMARLLCINHDSYWTQGDPSRFIQEAATVVGSMESKAVSPAGVFEQFLRYTAMKNGKTVPCDQTPRYVLYIDEILKLYPGSRVINMVRDPRAVLLSQKNKWKRRWMGYSNFPLKESIRTKINYHPITISMIWNASVRAVSRFADHPRVLLVKYEDIITNSESEVRKVCSFLGVQFHKEMLDIPQAGSSLTRFSSTGKGIDSSKAETWRKGGLNPTEIYICQKITGALMKLYGYQPIHVRTNPLMLIWYLLLFPLKSAMSLLLNLKRMKNIAEAIKRRL